MSEQLPNTPPPHDPITLIVGAGPTGLTLAIELARRGIPFRLIDKERERPATSRAIGTQPRTVEVFQIMGIPPAALEPAVRPKALRFAERERTLARLELDTSTPGAPGLISMDETDTERVLEERLQQLGGRIELGTELLGFRVEGDHVLARLAGPDGESEVRARFLVGADGAHSTVREAAGVSFAGATYPERFLLADLDIAWDLSHDEGHVWIGNEGLVAVIPLPGERRYRVIVPLPAEDSRAELTSEQQIAAEVEWVLRQRTKVPLRRVGEPVWASAFHIHRKLADRYRVGPVFLAGDAAHVHSPVGGQGMNTGIQDAFNLGWKLALAAQDRAAPGLLDTYESERRAVAENVLRGTDLGTRIVLADHPVSRTLRELLVPMVADLEPVRRRLLASISELRVGNRDSFLSVAADSEVEPGLFRRGRRGLRAGDRVPDAALLTHPDGEATSLFELFSQGWTLLLIAGDHPAPETAARLESVARQVQEMVGNAVKASLVLQAPPVGGVSVPVLIGSVGEVERVFGAREGLVALVRPDGYLAYRGRPEQAGELAAYLARVFAMRMRGVGALAVES
jgi:2-polyprenyl-6-methoxyphenol hydroxylase-like FAD-dependent oxidoreductase